MLRPHLRRFISFLPSVSPTPASRFQPAPLNSLHYLQFLRVPRTNFSSDSQSTEEAIQDAQIKPEIPKPTEKVVGKQSSYEFQAKTKKILDIVARSLYSEREVFVRELISNASDALEKARHYSMSGNPIDESDLPLQIKITTDEKEKVLIIQDTGMGMTEEELIKNLGTIARSGSEEFVKNLDATSEKNIIGQFGVGFYSAFMVSTHIEVFTRSAIPGSKGYCWTSEGHGSYEISEAEGVSRGTKIIVHLKDDALEFAQIPRLENIIQKYSNFVGFDILIGDEKVNTVKALWGLPPSKITEEEYKEFYQFISHAFDEPLYRLHFNTDSPLPLNSLLFVPAKHQEKFGLGKQAPGISIFSKKVLIQSRAPGVLPDWLRFVQGVIDSPEIPLSLSREHHKDILLLKRIGTLVTRKLLKLLSDEQKADPEKFEKFFDEHGQFLKEGICTDHQWKDQLSKLYMAESSKLDVGRKTNLDGYISRMKPEQNEIYYLANPNRNFAEASPYYEGFKQKDLEVLFVYLPIDEFTLGAIGEYAGKKIISIETSQVSDPADSSLNSDFVNWLKEVLKDRASSIQVTERLVSSPAFITDHESAAFRKMLKFVEPQKRTEIPKQDLKINPSHPLIKKLDAARISNPELAVEIAHQIMDNAMVVAGLHDDSRALIPRINKILDAAAESQL